MTERLADTVSGGFLLVVALIIGIAAQSLPTTITDQFAGPGFMPTFLSVCLAACAAGIVFQARTIPLTRRMPGWSGADLGGAIRIAVVAGATGAYNILLGPVGYLLVTFSYLLFLLWYLEVSWRRNLIITVVSTVASYAVFSIWLKVVLPMGFIEIYF
jgi:hypothetical protein